MLHSSAVASRQSLSYDERNCCLLLCGGFVFSDGLRHGHGHADECIVSISRLAIIISESVIVRRFRFNLSLTYDTSGLCNDSLRPMVVFSTIGKDDSNWTPVLVYTGETQNENIRTQCICSALSSNLRFL